MRDGWTAERLTPYRDVFSDPAAARGPLSYYRTALRDPLTRWRAARAHPVAVPTLIVWGMRDRFLGPWFLEPERLAPWFAAGNVPAVRRLQWAGHFVQNEAPEEVNRLLLEWLGDGDGRRPSD